jgi:hypothetical protein
MLIKNQTTISKAIAMTSETTFKNVWVAIADTPAKPQTWPPALS